MSEPTETQTQWPENGMRERIAELEAELAALKGRRCDECDSREGQSHYCLLLSINTGDAFYCDFWTARDEEGSGE